jgi:ElaB/YqjD/DUF883 family membrane-anchored ribosome-binding protein
MSEEIKKGKMIEEVKEEVKEELKKEGKDEAAGVNVNANSRFRTSIRSFINSQEVVNLAKEEVKANKEEKSEFCWKSVRLGGGIGCILGFMICGAICVMISRYSDVGRQRMVYVDIDRVITEVTSKILKTSDKGKASRQLQDYRTAFDGALDHYANKHNVIIFSSPKPIRGAEDKTEEIMARAFGELRDVAFKGRTDGQK